MNEPRPCPFCGNPPAYSEAIDSWQRFLECTSASCPIHPTACGQSRAHAIEIWNEIDINEEWKGFWRCIPWAEMRKIFDEIDPVYDSGNDTIVCKICNEETPASDYWQDGHTHVRHTSHCEWRKVHKWLDTHMPEVQP